MGGRGIILPNGMSRTDYIRQEFARGRTRGEIARELGVAYQVVYQATYGAAPIAARGQEPADPGSPEGVGDPVGGILLPLSTRVTGETAQALKDLATLERRTISEVVARALDEYVRATRFPGIVFVTGA